MVRARNDKILILALALCCLFLDSDFEVVTAHLPRICELFGSDNIQVVHGAAVMVKKVISLESSLIFSDLHLNLARNLMVKCPSAPFEIKENLALTLLALISIGSNEFVSELVDHGLAELFRDFIEMEVSTITMRVLQFVNLVGHSEDELDVGERLLSGLADCGCADDLGELLHDQDRGIAEQAAVVLALLQPVGGAEL
jgi:hypothetical protein